MTEAEAVGSTAGVVWLMAGAAFEGVVTGAVVCSGSGLRNIVSSVFRNVAVVIGGVGHYKALLILDG